MSRIECPNPECGLGADMTASGFHANAEFVCLDSITCITHGTQPPKQHSFPFQLVVRKDRHDDTGVLPAPHSVDALGAKVESAGNKTVTDVLGERGDLIRDITEARTANLW